MNDLVDYIDETFDLLTETDWVFLPVLAEDDMLIDLPEDTFDENYFLAPLDYSTIDGVPVVAWYERQLFSGVLVALSEDVLAQKVIDEDFTPVGDIFMTKRFYCQRIQRCTNVK